MPSSNLELAVPGSRPSAYTRERTTEVNEHHRVSASTTREAVLFRQCAEHRAFTDRDDDARTRDGSGTMSAPITPGPPSTLLSFLSKERVDAKDAPEFTERERCRDTYGTPDPKGNGSRR